MFATPLSLEPNAVVRLLVALRAAAALLIAGSFGAISLIQAPVTVGLWALPVALVVFDGVVVWQIRRAARPTASGWIALHLVFDSAVLFVLFWTTGGAANPFVSLFLVPVALAGVTLRIGHAAAVVALCTTAYSVLLLRYLDATAHPETVIGFERHVIGMWLNFVLAAVFLCVCLLALAHLLRRREQELAAQRERLLRDDAIVSVATVAAGAAHALNTPLATIAVAAESIGDAPELAPEVREEIDAIRSQVDLCAHHLRRLVAAQDTSARTALTLAEYAEHLITRWRTRHPETEVRVSGVAELPPRRVSADPALTQALINLLDNAADASRAAGRDTIAVYWQLHTQGGAELVLNIDDQGVLHSTEPLNRDLAATTKPHGLGLGLTLARASIARLGGQLRLTRNASGTTRTAVRLPLAALAANLPGR